MNAPHILRDLIESGIDVELTDSGTITVPANTLTDAQRQAIRANKAELVKLLAQAQAAANDALENFFHIDAPWRQAARQYQAHANTCPQCAAAGRGYGQRCAAGQQLWDFYNARQTNLF